MYSQIRNIWSNMLPTSLQTTLYIFFLFCESNFVISPQILLLLLCEISFSDKVWFKKAFQVEKSVFVNVCVDKCDNLLSEFLGSVPFPDFGLYSFLFLCLLLNFDFTPSSFSSLQENFVRRSKKLCYRSKPWWVIKVRFLQAPLVFLRVGGLHPPDIIWYKTPPGQFSEDNTDSQ